MPLALAVLHRPAAERVVELDRLVRRDALLVGRALRAEPVVQIPLQRAPAARLDGLEVQVRVALVQHAELVRRDRHGHLVLDAPRDEALLLAKARELEQS